MIKIQSPRNEVKSQCQSQSDPKWYASLRHWRGMHTPNLGFLPQII